MPLNNKTPHQNSDRVTSQ